MKPTLHKFAAILLLIYIFQSALYTQDSLQYYLEQARDLSNGTSDESVAATKRCITLSSPDQDAAIHVECSFLLARRYYDLGKPWEAERILIPAGDIARKNGLKTLLVKVKNMQAGVLASMERGEESWQLANEAALLAEELQDTFLMTRAALLQGTSILHFGQAEYELGMRKLERALQLSKNLEDQSATIIVLEHIAQHTKDPKIAESHLGTAIELYQELDNQVGLAWAYFELGFFYVRNDRLDEGLEALNTSLELHRTNGSVGGVSDVLLVLGDISYANGNYREAITQLEEALSTAQEIPLYPNIRDATASLSKSYSATGQFEQAYKYSELSGIYKDSTFHETLNRQLRESNDRFETEQKNQQITAQQLEIAEQSNSRNRILFGGITLLLATAGTFQFFLYRQRKRKREVEIALAEEAREAERLREMDELKTNFFTNVSHELRTPLTLVTSPLEEALGKVKQVNLIDDLALAHQNSRRLLGLVNEILDLSKVEAGAYEIEQVEVPLIPFLRRVFHSFKSAADLQQVSLDWQVSDAAAIIAKTDVAKVEKILNNLLANALKFTPPGGQISLNLEEEALAKENPQLKLQVRDTGQGIHPDDLPHIFDRFYQSSQPQAQGGTGIGLSLSRKLAQLLGGDLSATSEWQKGSTFYLQIPIAVKATQTINTPIAAPEDETEKSATPAQVLLFRSGRPQILIVEDNPEMSNYLVEKLRKDYDCQVAENGAAALALLHERPFDLITSDVMMPVMDGFALRESINQNADWKRIPFLLLTARTLEEDKIRGFQLGIDDYVTKPFSLPELKARIHNLLQNKKEREMALSSDQETKLVKPEDALLQQAEALVRERLDDPTFTVEEMARSLGHSQRNLARIFTQITGLTPVKFILELRLQHARQLLESRQFATVAEVRYEVGIESRSYFTTKFKERFGKSPKDYLS